MEPYYSSTERFHIGTRTWSPGPPLASARGWPGVAVMGKYLHLLHESKYESIINQGSICTVLEAMMRGTEQ